MVNYSNITPEAGMVMKKASGDDSPLRQGARKSSDLPETMEAATDFLLELLRYIYMSGDYIGEKGGSKAVQGGQTLDRRG